jgi:hypothetical protein
MDRWGSLATGGATGSGARTMNPRGTAPTLQSGRRTAQGYLGSATQGGAGYSSNVYLVMSFGNVVHAKALTGWSSQSPPRAQFAGSAS